MPTSDKNYDIVFEYLCGKMKKQLEIDWEILDVEGLKNLINGYRKKNRILKKIENKYISPFSQSALPDNLGKYNIPCMSYG